MSFFKEVLHSAGLNETALVSGYHVVNYGGQAVYVEGVKRLLKIGDDEIKLELFGALCTVFGENLRISELSDAIIIKGEVTNMEFTKTVKDEKREENKEVKKVRNEKRTQKI